MSREIYFRYKQLRGLAAILLLFIGLVSAATPAAANDPNYLNSGELLQRALETLFARIGATPKVSLVLVEPAFVTVVTQSSEAPDKAEEWTVSRFDYLLFDRDQVSGPAPHQSEGTVPGAEDSFFDISDVDVSRLEELTDRAIAHARLEDAAAVTSLRIAREAIFFPKRSYGPVQWRIGIASGRESATVYADAAGEITGADLSGTLRAQNLDMLVQDDWPAQDAQKELMAAIGDDAAVLELRVTKAAVSVATEVPGSPSLVRDYFWDYAGIRRGDKDRLNPIMHGAGDRIMPFRLDELELATLPSIKAAAREALGVPGAPLTGISAKKSPESGLIWRLEFVGPATGRGHVDVGTAGQIIAVEHPLAPQPNTPAP